MTPTDRAPTTPGKMLREEFLEPLALTVEALAERAGLTVETVRAVAEERARIVPELAEALARALGTTPEFWLGLQASSEPAEDDDMPSVGEPSPRFRVRPTRGANAHRRVTLELLRKGLGRTRADIARAMGALNEEVRQLEKQDALLLLDRYATALGARLELAFVFEDGRRALIAPGPGYLVGDDGVRRPLPDEDDERRILPAMTKAEADAFFAEADANQGDPSRGSAVYLLREDRGRYAAPHEADRSNAPFEAPQAAGRKAMTREELETYFAKTAADQGDTSVSAVEDLIKSRR